MLWSASSQTILWLVLLSVPYYTRANQDHEDEQKYAPCNISKVDVGIIRKCEKQVEHFSKYLKDHFKPDHYNVSIEYFHHPVTNVPTPNYIITITSDMFSGLKQSQRIKAVDSLLEPMLTRPYRLTINARGAVSAEFNDAELEIERLKQLYAKEFEEMIKEYHKPGPIETRIKDKLMKSSLDPDTCLVSNLSYRNDEPEDAETHFSVAICSFKFLRKSKEERENMVKRVLKEEIPLLKSLRLYVDVPDVLPTLLPPKDGVYNRKEVEVLPI